MLTSGMVGKDRERRDAGTVLCTEVMRDQTRWSTRLMEEKMAMQVMKGRHREASTRVSEVGCRGRAGQVIVI